MRVPTSAAPGWWLRSELLIVAERLVTVTELLDAEQWAVAGDQLTTAGNMLATALLRFREIVNEHK